MSQATNLSFALEAYTRTMRLAGQNDAVTSDIDKAAAELLRIDALNAELLDAIESYLEAQGALDNRELLGPNVQPYEVMRSKCNRAYSALEETIAKAKGAQ